MSNGRKGIAASLTRVRWNVGADHSSRRLRAAMADAGLAVTGGNEVPFLGWHSRLPVEFRGASSTFINAVRFVAEAEYERRASVAAFTRSGCVVSMLRAAGRING